MNDKPEQRLYRIGDYARFMGVSADLLKHYEKCGLIQSVTAENGYRFYPFHASVPLLECMRLQQYGFSLREAKHLMQDASYKEAQQMLDRRAEDLQRQITFQQMVIDEHRHIAQWMKMMEDKDTLVVVKDMEPVLFLPQSQHREFIDDKRITALLPAWVDAMPLVKSCCLRPCDNTDKDPSWGLSVTQSHAEKLQLPVNDVVQHIPGGRYAHVHFRYSMKDQTFNLPELVQQILQPYAIEPDRYMLHFSLMSLHNDGHRISCGWFSVSLRQKQPIYSPAAE